MSKKKTDQLYTLPVEYAEELTRETEEQISTTIDLLEDLLTDEASAMVIPVVVEILWANYSILNALSQETEEPTLHLNEQTQEEEYIFLEDIIYSLQSLLLTRYYANLRLNKLSYSVSLH